MILLAEEKSPKEIATVVGCSESLVRQIQRGDIESRYSFYSDAELYSAVKFHARLAGLHDRYHQAAADEIRRRSERRLIDTL